MAKKKPRRRTAAKIATKGEQQRLVEAAKRLAEDPTPLVPRIEGKVKDGPVKRLQRSLAKVAKKRGSPRWLGWYTKRGPMLARSYATLLLIDARGASSHMASMPTPVGPLKYAYRGGNVRPRVLLGVQHHHQDLVRIMAYRELAQQTDGVVWTVPGGTVLTGKKDRPPSEWIGAVREALPFELTTANEDGALVLRPAAMTSGPDDLRFRFELPTGPLVVLLDEPTLLSHPDAKVLHTVGQRFIGLEVHRNVELGVEGYPWHLADPAARAPLDATRPEFSKKRLEAYLAGGVPESVMLDEARARWRDGIIAGTQEILVLGDTCYGADRAAFVAAVDAGEDQRRAIRLLLDAHAGPLVVEDHSSGKVIEALWSHAATVLPQLLGDDKALSRILRQHDRSSPAVVLEEVLNAGLARERLAGYPYWEALPDAVAGLDQVFRAQKARGRTAALETADRILKGRTHKGVLHAVLAQLDGLQGREWRFDRNDQDAGEFLSGPVRETFEAAGGDYAEKLAAVHTLAGGVGDLPVPEGTM